MRSPVIVIITYNVVKFSEARFNKEQVLPSKSYCNLVPSLHPPWPLNSTYVRVKKESFEGKN